MNISRDDEQSSKVATKYINLAKKAVKDADFSTDYTNLVAAAAVILALEDHAKKLAGPLRNIDESLDKPASK